MRLIDADAVYKRVQECYEPFPGAQPLLYVLMKILDEEQTVDPVVHARWINHKHPDGSSLLVCSHCGFEDESPYNFCPACGAKMDEDKPFGAKWRLLNGKWTCSECGNKTDWPLKICNVCASEMEIEL